MDQKLCLAKGTIAPAMLVPDEAKENRH